MRNNRRRSLATSAGDRIQARRWRDTAVVSGECGMEARQRQRVMSCRLIPTSQAVARAFHAWRPDEETAQDGTNRRRSLSQSCSWHRQRRVTSMRADGDDRQRDNAHRNRSEIERTSATARRLRRCARPSRRRMPTQTVEVSPAPRSANAVDRKRLPDIATPPAERSVPIASALPDQGIDDVVVEVDAHVDADRRSHAAAEGQHRKAIDR